MTDENATLCAHAGCTCHTQDGARYCSDACRTSSETGVHNGCRCAHAGCTASAYVRPRPSTEVRRWALRSQM